MILDKFFSVKCRSKESYFETIRFQYLIKLILLSLRTYAGKSNFVKPAMKRQAVLLKI